MNDPDEFEALEIGQPVFMDGHAYKVVNDEFVRSTKNDSTDCVPGVVSNGDYKTFVGVCVKKYSIGAKVLMGDGVQRYVEFKQNCIEFATHGDYVFKVNDTSNMNIGDTLLFDGSVLNDETPINNKINSSIVGVITEIYDSNYLSVFKT